MNLAIWVTTPICGTIKLWISLGATTFDHNDFDLSSAHQISVFFLLDAQLLYGNKYPWMLWDYKVVHYCDVIMGAIAPQITSLTIVYSTVYSVVDQRKHQSSASLAFVRGIHRARWSVTRKMFPFDDVIMIFTFILIREWNMCLLGKNASLDVWIGHAYEYIDTSIY